ncbi:MAG: hypothetical protein KF775_11705 [Cyclobacteriaceae bacterium]|jgi:hypothetical protein|nr:hypothetical protein [Cyclobacteriaceae bacterium]
MNIKNFEFLRDGLKYLGFGEKLEGDLKANIEKQPADFKLNTENEFKRGDKTEKVTYTIDFRKGDQGDMYFLNRYHATLKNEEDPTKDKTQTFYITKNHGITAKEAYNLLSGRSVNKDLTTKEGQPFNAWVKLDLEGEKDKNNNFKVEQYHQGYGYDLDKVLAKHPIKELNNPELKERIMKSLEKGNTTSVTMMKDGQEQKMHIEANPKFKSVDVYDQNMKRKYQQNEKQGKENTQEADKSKDKKESVKVEDDDDSPRQTKKKKRGVGV